MFGVRGDHYIIVALRPLKGLIYSIYVHFSYINCFGDCPLLYVGD